MISMASAKAQSCPIIKEGKLTRDTAMFVYHYKIRDLVGSAGLYELLDDVVTSVDPVRVGKHQSQFLSC